MISLAYNALRLGHWNGDTLPFLRDLDIRALRIQEAFPKSVRLQQKQELKTYLETSTGLIS